MNLGAGRVVMQDLPRIDAAIADSSFARNPALQDAIAKLKQAGGTAHVMGLISPGGVHSHQDQIAVLAEVLAEAGLPVAVHAFLAGRDTPRSEEHTSELQALMRITYAVFCLTKKHPTLDLRQQLHN